jgi:ArsR family transcriptional regulator, arsenate/arsenite/antimonite-responsive transcriptional repressor
MWESSVTDQDTIRPRDPIKLQQARVRLSRNRAQLGMARLRKALCDPARLQIIEALSGGALCVNDLALAIERAPAATSQHLRVLRELDLVAGARRGTSIYYSLTPGAATQLEGVLSSLAALPAASSR